MNTLEGAESTENTSPLPQEPPRLRQVWNSIIYTAGNLAPQVANLLLLPVLTRYLSSAEYGIFGYTTAIGVFVLLFGSVSIHSYALRHAFDCKTDLERRRLFGTLFVFLALYSTALLALGLTLGPALFHHFGVQVPFDPYMRLALLSVAIETVAIIPLTYFRTREQAVKFMTLSFLQFGLSMGLSLYLIIWVNAGLLGRYYGQLAANLILLLVYIVIMVRVAELCLDWRQVRKAVVFSLPIAIAGLLGALTAMFDRIVLERHVSLAALGVYSVGSSLGQGLSSLSIGIYRAVEPAVYRLGTDSGFDDRMVLLKERLVALLTVVGCVAIVFSREVVALMADPSFFESYRIMALVSARAVIAGVAIPASVYIVAVKRTGYVAGVDLVGALVSVIGNLTLIVMFGIYGAAATGILAALLILGGYTTVTERLGEVRWGMGRDVMWLLSALAGAAVILHVGVANPIATVLIKATLVAMFGAAWIVGYLRGAGRARRLLASGLA